MRKSLLEIERSGWSWGVEWGVSGLMWRVCLCMNVIVCLRASASWAAGVRMQEREPSSRGKPPPYNTALPIAYNLSPLTLAAAQYVCWGTVVGKVAFCSHQHPFCPSNCPRKQRVPRVGTLFVFSVSISNWQLKHSRKFTIGCLRECSAWP